VRPKLTQKIISSVPTIAHNEPHEVRPKQTHKIVRDISVWPSNGTHNPGHFIEIELPSLRYKCKSKQAGLRVVPAKIAALAVAKFAKMRSGLSLGNLEKNSVDEYEDNTDGDSYSDSTFPPIFAESSSEDDDDNDETFQLPVKRSNKKKRKSNVPPVVPALCDDNINIDASSTTDICKVKAEKRMRREKKRIATAQTFVQQMHYQP